MNSTTGEIQTYLGKFICVNQRRVLVESILGQGGFAFVFLVRTFDQQRYALKRMYVNNNKDLNVCQQEIQLLKQLIGQPNIVQYVDATIRRLSSSNRDDDEVYEILLLTEYCANGSLINRLNSPLGEHQILRIFADLCRAVSVCHFHRPQAILHRDIKLENLIIDARQNIFLCDFGSAVLLSKSKTSEDFEQFSSEQLTTHQIQQLEEDIQRYTTVSYRAPEMVNLYSRIPLTLKCDIWSMGCFLFKLMYNTMPFGESILAIQNGTFLIPDRMSNVYSRELNLLVRSMLEIDIKKRLDIWQISYLTFKLLGQECPIPNRCQSNYPDVKSIPMPLTESEHRQQRSIKAKSTSSQTFHERSASIGTAINPRERPRGILPPSTSLFDLQKTSVRPTPRSDSAAPLMFDDDFGSTSVSTGPTHRRSVSQTISQPVNSTPTPTVQQTRCDSPADLLLPLSAIATLNSNRTNHPAMTFSSTTTKTTNSCFPPQSTKPTVNSSLLDEYF